ncbi:acetyl-CoA decarbonylase/synthase complex subunit delta [Candidatus Bipolaricaulota bacterium]|nr:acetyl-CoA decarbonylase/synthase complex subunit delta [Candidatus Bipolaricaulota bacterium]
MQIPDVSSTWENEINSVTIGATEEEGGTRSRTVTIGGETTMPYLHFEGTMPNHPVLAFEIWDVLPEDWPQITKEPFGDVMGNPVEWAQKCEEDFEPDLLSLRLMGCDPYGEDRSPEEAAKTVERVLEATTLPLIIWGSGDDEKDNEVFTLVSPAAEGENCLLGTITEDNYRTLAALGKADDHKVIAESPVDINIAKQVNTLALDVGYDLENIVIFPDSPALGYGIEYVYSIMERTRLAGLKGDRLMAQPMLANIGGEVWKTKEAKINAEERPNWGDNRKRGPLWEATTAFTYLQAGADLVIMRHPKALNEVGRKIERLMDSGGK